MFQLTQVSHPPNGLTGYPLKLVSRVEEGIAIPVLIPPNSSLIYLTEMSDRTATHKEVYIKQEE